MPVTPPKNGARVLNARTGTWSEGAPRALRRAVRSSAASTAVLEALLVLPGLLLLRIVLVQTLDLAQT